MACRRKAQRFGAALIVSLIVCSCAHVQKASVEDSLKLAQEQLKKDQYREALDTFRMAQAHYPADRRLTDRYLGAVETVRGAGDKANARNDFDKARGTYQILLSSYGDFEAFATRLSFDRGALKKLIARMELNKTDRNARLEISQGNPRRALDLYRSVYRLGIDQPEFRKVFSERLEEIKQNADRDFSQGDCARAGAVFFALERDFPFFDSFAQVLSYKRETLRGAIARCSECLKMRGMTLYRSGRIAEAIPVWESILQFDDNQEIRKIIRNASGQLEQLKR